MIERQIVTKTVKTVVADGQIVSLGEVEIEDPSLVLSTYEVMQVVADEPTTVELSYLGEGTITVTNPNPTALSATYDSVARTITLVNNLSEEDDNVDVNLTVSLNRSGNCVTESVTLTVHCSPVGLDPQLTLGGEAYAAGSSPVYDDSANQYALNHGISYYDGEYWGDKIYVTVNYLGGGQITSSPDTNYTWNADTKQLIYGDYVEGVQTISLSASPPYAAVTTTFYIERGGIMPKG